MSNVEGFITLNFNKVISEPSTTIVFTDPNIPSVDKYISLDVIVDELMNNARLGDIPCQELLKQITIGKFNAGELTTPLEFNAVVV